MIPETNQAAVARALQETFGVNEFEDIRVLTGGLTSALVFRIVVRGNPYVLRLIMRADAMGDPTRQFACMKSAAEAGIAPRVWYASIEDRVSITDFVHAKPFPDNAAPRIADTIRRLYLLPPFPPLMNYFDTIDGFIRRFQAAKLLPESATEELFGLYAGMMKVYPRNDPDLVPSHNDLKPENILFDGDRVWLVDWEAAFLNDRYFDLAVAANFFVQDEAAEEAWLATYFGQPPDEYQRARFYLMRQAVHMSYATCFMLIAASSGTPIVPDLYAPDFRDFHRRIASGEVSLTTGEARQQYAKVHLNQALRNMRTRRFEDALARVAAYHASA